MGVDPLIMDLLTGQQVLQVLIDISKQYTSNLEELCKVLKLALAVTPMLPALRRELFTTSSQYALG